MTGKIICLVFMAGSLLAWLFLKIRNQEKNKQDAMKILALAGLFGFLICLSDSAGQKLTEDGRLIRNKAGEGPDTQQLQLDADGMLNDYDYTLEVEEQRFKDRELKQIFIEAADEAQSMFLADNVSADCIENSVLLPKKLYNGQIHTDWQFEPEGIIDREGNLNTEGLDATGAMVMVTLTMTYYDKAQIHSFGCQVYPKKLTNTEQLLADLEKYFEKEQEQSKNKEYLKLPMKMNGAILRWSQKAENTYHIILLTGLAAAAVVYVQQGLREQKQQQNRRDQLLRQYPDMVSKVSLLLGAGMTLSGAWERIVLNYQRQLERHQAQKLEVYEQMLLSYREMQDGVGELKVYERFGERCGTPQYRKLTMLIIQNLRKGSDGLTKTLEKEVAEAFALRKNQAKKAGEEAGTKILVPMVLMLCIVMIIILVPAFLTFQM